MRKKERDGQGWMDGWMDGPGGMSMDIEKEKKKERWEKIKKEEKKEKERCLEQPHARTMIV